MILFNFSAHESAVYVSIIPIISVCNLSASYIPKCVYIRAVIAI